MVTGSVEQGKPTLSLRGLVQVTLPVGDQGNQQTRNNTGQVLYQETEYKARRRRDFAGKVTQHREPGLGPCPVAPELWVQGRGQSP